MRSGSLKDLATTYSVSYPTIRARLDRVIERLGNAVAGKPPDPLSDMLANLVASGELSVTTARAIREVARAQAESQSPASSPASPMEKLP